MLIAAAVALSTLLIVCILFLPSRLQTGVAHDGLSVTILVLGDIGRSPRMQYHALSIAQHGGHVQLVGYAETSPLDELQAHDNVSIVPIPSPPRLLQTRSPLFFLLLAPVKVVFQVWMLWQILCYSVKPAHWLLIQNPPSIPSLAIGALVCACRGQKLLIDWHNFGWSILALKLGDGHPFVRISALYEYVFAWYGHAHFAVTSAMAKQLQTRVAANSPVLVLHDRPAELFQPLTSTERVAFLQRYNTVAPFFNALVSGKARLLVSSTSWTADEDFSVFLQALSNYSAAASSAALQLPDLLVVITGKGPLQGHYLREIDRMEKQDQLKRVKVYTDWLSFTDYAQLLGSADLGVSLHTSSSGVDLPMKVVDMFGAGLPVLGWSKFAAWPELVTEGVNGRGFSSIEQMTTVLCELFSPGNSQLVKLKAGAVKESQRRWKDEWDPVAGKFLGLVS
ncbi:hypothetical protein DV735_g4711, partial [Chaetothyriales sp. CBS 134920]